MGDGGCGNTDKGFVGLLADRRKGESTQPASSSLSCCGGPETKQHRKQPLAIDTRSSSIRFSIIFRPTVDKDSGSSKPRLLSSLRYRVRFAHLLDELLHAVALPRGQHVVAGLVPLDHEPHPLDVVLGVAPVTVFFRRFKRKQQGMIDACMDGGGVKNASQHTALNYR